MSPPPNDLDELTGLASASAGRAILTGAVAHNGRVALLLCGIDHMRTFNKQFGIDEGDRQIVRVARTLKDVAAPFPVFRLAGDVFGIVIQERSLDEVRDLAAQILSAQKPVKVPVEGGTEVEALTVSIGMALFPEHAINADNLLYAADIALLKVKRGGRLPDGTRYPSRNRAMTWGDFLDEFPHESARFLNPEFVAPGG